MQLLFFILGYFLPFFAFTFKSSKKQNFKKMKKQTKIKNKIKQQQQQQPGDIVLHKCMKNHDHMLYCSWDIWYMTDGIFHSRLFFALLPPPPLPNSPKKENFKKRTLEISWSYAILFLRYMVCDGCNCYFSFWAILFPFTALTAQKIKISKNHKKQQIKQTNKKIPRDIKLHMCTKDYD